KRLGILIAERWKFVGYWRCVARYSCATTMGGGRSGDKLTIESTIDTQWPTAHHSRSPRQVAEWNPQLQWDCPQSIRYNGPNEDEKLTGTSSLLNEKWTQCILRRPTRKGKKKNRIQITYDVLTRRPPVPVFALFGNLP